MARAAEATQATAAAATSDGWRSGDSRRCGGIKQDTLCYFHSSYWSFVLADLGTLGTRAFVNEMEKDDEKKGTSDILNSQYYGRWGLRC